MENPSGKVQRANAFMDPISLGNTINVILYKMPAAQWPDKFF